MRPPRVRYLPVALGEKLGIGNFPSFGPRGSVTGMRRQFYGNEALLVRCGAYVYNVSQHPHIYWQAH